MHYIINGWEQAGIAIITVEGYGYMSIWLCVYEYVESLNVWVGLLTSISLSFFSEGLEKIKICFPDSFAGRVLGINYFPPNKCPQSSYL